MTLRLLSRVIYRSPFLWWAASSLACGGCGDVVQRSTDATDATADGASGDGSINSRTSNDEPGVPTAAGVPGECTTDGDCRNKYDDIDWPYLEKGDLRCAVDPSSGLGYCTECERDSDCPDDSGGCHLGRFCWPDPAPERFCGSDADCKANQDSEGALHGWSPLHPARCIPSPCSQCDSDNVMPTRCSQCEHDSQCTPGGRCEAVTGVCFEPCTETADCPTPPDGVSWTMICVKEHGLCEYRWSE